MVMMMWWLMMVMMMWWLMMVMMWWLMVMMMMMWLMVMMMIMWLMMVMVMIMWLMMVMVMIMWLMVMMMWLMMVMMWWLMMRIMWMVGMWIMGLIMLVIRIVGFASGRHGVLRQEVLAEELVQEEDARGDLIGHISDFSGLVGLNLLLLGNGSSRLGVGLLCLREAVIRCTDLRAGWHEWRGRALPGRAGARSRDRAAHAAQALYIRAEHVRASKGTNANLFRARHKWPTCVIKRSMTDQRIASLSIGVGRLAGRMSVRRVTPLRCRE
ncbi:hypothetical protein Emag_002904 [Eimeria magna]